MIVNQQLCLLLALFYKIPALVLHIWYFGIDKDCSSVRLLYIYWFCGLCDPAMHMQTLNITADINLGHQ